MTKIKPIPYGRQWINRSDIRAVERVLRSDRITQGPRIQEFEKAFAAYCGAPYAVAVSSGTAGLHLAALAAGFGPGDEVITTPLTFVASANCILYTGATPRFADVDSHTLGLDPGKARAAITTRTRGAVSVDFAGQPCVLGPKKKFDSNKNFVLIEDACHALGAQVHRNGWWARVGACLDEDMAVFSFHPVKHITTGEGGMVTTRRREWAEKLRLLRSHGIEKSPENFIEPNGSRRPWHYEMKMLGFNYRITDIQCALGLSQLGRIHQIVERRRRIASFYKDKLKNVEFLRLPEELPDRRSSYHLYVLRIDFKALKVSRESVMQFLRKRGILTQVHYIPLTHQPYYAERFGFRKGRFPVTEAYYEEALSIPIFPTLTVSDTRKVVSAVKEIYRTPCH